MCKTIYISTSFVKLSYNYKLKFSIFLQEKFTTSKRLYTKLKNIEKSRLEFLKVKLYKPYLSAISKTLQGF